MLPYPIRIFFPLANIRYLLVIQALQRTVLEQQLVDLLYPPEADQPSLPARSHDLDTYMVTPECGIMGIIRQVLTERVMVSKFYNFLKGFQLHNEYLQSKSFCRWKGKHP